jgi:hypothetical protein
MQITLLADFLEQSKKLVELDLANSRYTMKYRHVDGKLVLKVTNDKVVSETNDIVLCHLPLPTPYECHDARGSERIQSHNLFSTKVFTLGFFFIFVVPQV